MHLNDSVRLRVRQVTTDVADVNLVGLFCVRVVVHARRGQPTMRTDRTCWENVEFSLWCSLCSHTSSAGGLQHEERSFGVSVFSYRHFPRRGDRERGMLCPNRRPPRRNMPKMGCCGRGGLRFGTIPGEQASGVHVGAHTVGSRATTSCLARTAAQCVRTR